MRQEERLMAESSLIGRIGPSLEWLGESREILKRLPSIDQLSPCIVVCGAQT